MKKVVKITALAVFAFITGLNVYKAQTEVQLSDAQMKNVEALANQEYISSLIQLTPQGWVCYNTVRDDMYVEYFLCTDCNGCLNTTASHVSNSSYCSY